MSGFEWGEDPEPLSPPETPSEYEVDLAILGVHRAQLELANATAVLIATMYRHAGREVPDWMVTDHEEIVAHANEWIAEVKAGLNLN